MGKLEQLRELFGSHSESGFVETNLEAVHLLWATGHVERSPLIYEAGLVLILQGTKIGYQANRVFQYDPGQYLVLSVPVSFECEVFGSEEAPLICLFIDIDRTELHELVSILDGKVSPSTDAHQSPLLGIAPAVLANNMSDAIGRLLDVLCSPIASKALGKGILREILFHALTEKHGPALRELTKRGSHHDNIAKVIALIHDRYAETLSNDMLAAEAHMSTSNFHRVFKNITGSSPHQHIKAIRLQRARDLIVIEGLPVGKAAHEVGYDNSAHFSREFKKYFGVSPKNARAWG